MTRADAKPIAVEAILFDLDGVLVDSRRPIARSLNHALEASGLAARPEAALHAYVGDRLYDVCAALLREQGADPALAPDMIERYRERYRSASLEETTLFDGIEDALDPLGSRHVLAVATSKPVEYARPILERLGLAGRFAAIIGPPLVPPEAEAKAATVERTLGALGIPLRPFGAPPAAAMVGDRHHDVGAGRALGLATVGVTWGIGSEKELRGAGVERLVRSPAELPGLFGAL